MTREQIQKWIDEGCHVLRDGRPEVVEGDIWSYLDTLDEENADVWVLEDLVKWSDEELKSLTG